MNILYRSNFCSVVNYICECSECAISQPEYQDHFSFCFIRKGNFLFKTFRDDLDCYTGKILINKPTYDYRVAHIHKVPDQCTIFTFAPKAFAEFLECHKENLNGFLQKRDVQSLLIKSTVAIDYLHLKILETLKYGNFTTLYVECLLMELVDMVFSADQSERVLAGIPCKHKQHYLPKIEHAKEFIQNNFSDNISLHHIADACAMSQFHFARIFRRVAEITPYQYLFDFRYSHAEHLLRNKQLSISEISHLSGYNSPSHLATVFKKKSKSKPTSYRSKFI